MYNEEKIKWISVPDSVLMKEQEKKYGKDCPGKWIWPCAYVRGHLRKDFTVPKPVKKADLYFECDNSFDLFLNGYPIEDKGGKADIAVLLKEGENTIFIRVYQTGSMERFTSAIRGGIHLVYEDQTEEMQLTDSDWKALRVGDFYTDCEPKDWLCREDFPEIEKICEEIHPFFLRHSFYFKKRFYIRKPVAKAVLRVGAEGCYKAFANGRPVSDDKFAPGAMEEVKEYQEYDISGFLSRGENVVGFLTGNGWFNCRSWGELTAKKNRIWFKIRVTYTDESEEVFSPGGDCLAAFSPLIDNDIQFGERYDARLEIPDWCSRESRVEVWFPVQVSEEGVLREGGTGEAKGILCRQDYPSVKPEEYLSAVEKRRLSGQRMLYDFGRSVSGRIRIRIWDAKDGERVILRYYERRMPDGDLCAGPYLPVYYPKDAVDGKALWSVRNVDVYICREAQAQSYESEFTYTGFRYVVLERKKIDERDEAEAVCMHQNLEERGHIATPYQPVMQLWEMTKRSYRGNIVGGPTDCPTREKNFWNGDIQTFAPAACWYMDNRKFLGKWSRFGRKIEYGVYGWEDEEYILPWTLYWFYGDTEILREKYPDILRLAERREADIREHLTRQAHAPYRDHLAVRNVPADFFADCYYCLMLLRISQIADILGDGKTAAEYERKRALSAEAFHKKYYLEETGDYAPQCQGGIVLPLAFGLTPKKYRDKAAEKLNEYCVENGYHMTTG